MSKRSLAGMRRPTDAELSAVRSDPRFVATQPKAVAASNRALRPRIERIEMAEQREAARHAAALDRFSLARSAAHHAARQASLRIERDAYEVALVRIMLANDKA